jgi:hypothetical protein
MIPPGSSLTVQSLGVPRKRPETSTSSKSLDEPHRDELAFPAIKLRVSLFRQRVAERAEQIPPGQRLPLAAERLESRFFPGQICEIGGQHVSA